MSEESDGNVVLPKGWPEMARGAFLSAVAMGRMALLQGLSGFEHGRNPKARLFAELEAERARSALLVEEIRIKDARFARIPAQKRPHYPPADRLAILTAQATAGWNLTETARRFQVTPKTIASWLERVDDHGEPELVAPPVPVNRYPDFLRFLVQRLRVTQPSFGRRRIADCLARAGIDVAPSTVRRIITEEPVDEPLEPDGDSVDSDEDSANEDVDDGEPEEVEPTERVVTARYPHHLWHIDATLVPTALGFWVPWLPNSIPVVWPFAFWVVGVLDHYSRAVVATGVYGTLPTAEEVVALLERGVAAAGTAPKHIVSDRGVQFQSEYLAWCRRRGVEARFGAIGKHGSIAIIERFWRSMKTELFRRIRVPLNLDQIATELDLYCDWYNRHRPHQGLGGLTPAERFEGVVPARDLPRMETRRDLPIARGDPAPVRRRVERLKLVVTPLEGRNHLPIIKLRDAA